MAQPTSSGKTPAETRLDGPDWTAELQQSKREYAEANAELKEAIKVGADEKYIQHLRETMQDAQKRVELLLQRQSQPEAQHSAKRV